MSYDKFCQICGHDESAHFSCYLGSYCKLCTTEDNAWEHDFKLCPDGLLPDGNACPRCGVLRAPSGVDGGSWVHVSTRPDRIVSSQYEYGTLVKQVLANGVVLRRKNVDIHEGR